MTSLPISSVPDMVPTGGPIRILYVLGRGRSGSTFLERSAAKVFGATILGEVRLWPICYHDDHMCSCGKVKTQCPFWSKVVDTLPEPENTRAAFRKTIGRSFLISLLLPRKLTDRFFPGVRKTIGAFYRHLAEQTGLSVGFDSSKNPAYAMVLDQAEGIDLTLIHVVRHPLGVVYSWKRQRERAQTNALYRMRKPLALAAIEWTFSNALAELVKARAKNPSVTLAYEKLNDPDTQIALENIGNTLPASVDTGLGTDHLMSGNPGSAARTDTFKVDEEWRTGLAWWEKAIYGALCYPLYILYRKI